MRWPISDQKLLTPSSVEAVFPAFCSVLYTAHIIYKWLEYEAAASTPSIVIFVVMFVKFNPLCIKRWWRSVANDLQANRLTFWTWGSSLLIPQYVSDKPFTSLHDENNKNSAYKWPETNFHLFSHPTAVFAIKTCDLLVTLQVFKWCPSGDSESYASLDLTWMLHWISTWMNTHLLKWKTGNLYIIKVSHHY